MHLSASYLEILNRIDAVRKKENRMMLFYGILITVFIGLIISLIVVLIESILHLETLGRTILFFIALIGIVLLAVWYIIRPILRIIGVTKSSDNASIALRVGSYFPTIRDRLLDVLELYENRETLKQSYSLQLIDASFADLYNQIKSINFLDSISNSSIKRMGKFVVYALITTALIFGISPTTFYLSAYRLVNYSESFIVPPPIIFAIEPGNIEAVRGQDIPIIIRIHGKAINNTTFKNRPVSQPNFNSQNLTAGKDGVFRTTIKSIKTTTEYYATVGDISSEKYKITVFDRPLIRSLKLSVFPPAYTRIPSKTMEENIGEVHVYPGTKLDIKLTASKNLSSADMVFKNGTRLPFRCSENNAQVSLTVRQNQSYYVAIVDQKGLQNINPVEYDIRIIPDEFPKVEILSPARNIDLTEQMNLDLLIRMKDDFGISKLRLAYRLIHSRYEPPAQELSYLDILLPQSNITSIDLPFIWDVSSLKLVPEDVVAYYVEVFDNDIINGPKSGKSEMYLIRLPSLEEVFTDVAQTHQQSLESMRSMAQETQQLKKELDDLHREIKQSRDKIDWQQQRKAEEILKRFEALKKKLEEASQKMDEMMKQMDDNKLLSPQTLDKYFELQKLMDQLKSPELQEALKKLQETMKQLSFQEMRQAMQQVQFSEEQFRKSLERTIELLKRIHIEQKIDELIKRTEELLKQQEALKQETAKTNQSDELKLRELAQKQRDLKKQVEALEKETANLKEKMEEFPKEMPLEEMNKAQEELDQQQLQDKMEAAARQMQSGNMQMCQLNQQKTKEGLNTFLEQMKNVQKSLLDKQMKQIVNEMRKQIQNMIELSMREEDLKDESSKMNPNSSRFRQSAQKQMEIFNDLENVADALSQLAKKTFAISPEMGKEIGNAMKSMSEAIQQIELRNPIGTSQKQHEAMSSLNKAAMMMQNALNGMMQGRQSGMGMASLMARLNQMLGMQGSINLETQQAFAMGQGQGLSQEQMAEYRRIAAQQGAVQKSLEQLAQEAKYAGEFSKLLGDLDRISQDMIEVQTDLEQGNVNPETIKKQERIFSRLLDSQRSMRERDYEKRRRAEAGKSILRQSPAEFDLSTQEGKNKLREELLKALEGKYSKDYEELIKRYFERLEKEEINY